MQGEAVFDPARAGACSLDQLRRNPHPVAVGKLKLETVEAEEHLQFMVFGHAVSYQA
jgi:hypothetical protein